MTASTTFSETELIIGTTKKVLKTIINARLVDLHFWKQRAYNNASEVIAGRSFIEEIFLPRYR